MPKKKSQKKNLAYKLPLVILGFIILALLVRKVFLGIVPIWQSWQEYQPKCRALADNIRLFVPTNWKISANRPIYDGEYINPPKTTAQRDFNNLVTHCELAMGFKEEPGYQEINHDNYGSIFIRADKINVPKNLSELSSSSYLKEFRKEPAKIVTMKEHKVLIQNAYHITSYSLIHNHALIELALQMHPRANNNPRVQNYLRQTFTAFFDRLILLD